ncbi:MAG TPA: HAMP domain-containing sensor histidine kinase [Bacteroidales bacterium]|nr:HAMP domain-containing sensor histidine kinase [Bacteroidales bacterium]
MNIRIRILLYFSAITIILTGALLIFVYTLFSHFRENSFHEEQAIKIKTTLKILAVRKQIDKTMIESIDTVTIQELYNEKLMIFDHDKTLVYKSIDDTQIPYYLSLLNRLNEDNQQIELEDNQYDVVGIYLEQDGKGFYGICKAYDASGYKVLDYLKRTFIFSFLGISCILFVLLFYFSGQITNSILHVTRQIRNYDFERNVQPITCKNDNDEIALLVKRFNQLLEEMNKAYLFQKHAVHHISHELKTPISVLVSNFEKIEKENLPNQIKEHIRIQKEETKSLGDIINSLLEIARVESGKVFDPASIRIDELLFDVADELKIIHPEFQFLIELDQELEDEKLLIVKGNLRLLKTAFLNIMVNDINYSKDNSANIFISYNGPYLQLRFVNTGMTISPDEQQYIFQHFFRGNNSNGKRGFGLGLVLVHRILMLHKGQISYRVNENSYNEFKVLLPYMLQ